MHAVKFHIYVQTFIFVVSVWAICFVQGLLLKSQHRQVSMASSSVRLHMMQPTRSERRSRILRCIQHERLTLLARIFGAWRAYWCVSDLERDGIIEAWGTFTIEVPRSGQTQMRVPRDAPEPWPDTDDGFED